jgi:hypothetical protein
VAREVGQSPARLTAFQFGNEAPCAAEIAASAKPLQFGGRMRMRLYRLIDGAMGIALGLLKAFGKDRHGLRQFAVKKASDSGRLSARALRQRLQEMKLHGIKLVRASLAQ